MTRDQKIADLVLHGYVPYEDPNGWVSIWRDERGEGRMCRFFDEGEDGPGWDVRAIISALVLNPREEIAWDQVRDDALNQLTASELPPKFKHGMAGIERALAKMDALGVNTLGPDDL